MRILANVGTKVHIVFQLMFISEFLTFWDETRGEGSSVTRGEGVKISFIKMFVECHTFWMTTFSRNICFARTWTFMLISHYGVWNKRVFLKKDSGASYLWKGVPCNIGSQMTFFHFSNLQIKINLPHVTDFEIVNVV